MKNYDENKESSYWKYWDVNNLYGWAMLLKLVVKDLSEFDQGLLKSFNEKCKKGYFLEVDI